MGWSAQVCPAERKAKQSKAKWSRPCSSGRAVTCASQLIFHSRVYWSYGSRAELLLCCSGVSDGGQMSDLRAQGSRETANGERHLHRKNTNHTWRAPKALCCAVLYNLYPRGRKWFSSPGLINLSRDHISTTAHQVSDSSKNTEQPSPANTQKIQLFNPSGPGNKCFKPETFASRS